MRAARIFFAMIVLSLFGIGSNAQTCSFPGQTPSTAFPICGTKSFQQANVPICSSHDLKVPGCSSSGGAEYKDINPYWYSFTCYQSGTLGFSIIPNNLKDDYDWQLFDITGHNASEVFTNVSLVVTGNWSGSYGVTGAKSGGSKSIECASDPKAKEITFAAMPDIIEGHKYLLLVSHFTQTQSGYSLSFSGGTGSITDTTQPRLKDIRANCEANQVILRINKKMKCASLATDGSDFAVTGNGVSVVSAEAPGCNNGFDMDSVILTLNKALPPGDYTVSVKTGTDGNTLLDNCDNDLQAGVSLPLLINPKQRTPFDSIAPVTCAPQTLEFVFRKPIRCNSIAADGSDFTIAGPNPLSIDGAYGICTDEGVTSSVFVHLLQPAVLAGTYTVTIKTGNDGNVIIDECGEETPGSESLSFAVKDTVSANFTTSLAYGCHFDTINTSHDGSHDVNSWEWLFATYTHREGQRTQVVYDSYGEREITLIVSNGFCTDTMSSIINLDNELKAAFIPPDIACPNEPAIITDTSIGNIISYQWDFGNGIHSSDKNPSSQVYPQANGNRQYPIELIVENNLHCFDTAIQQLTVAYSCFITVPSAFTPNGDGINDYLYPLNAYKADNLVFTVYNRLGQVVFRTQDRTKKWDGTINGQPQSSGTFVWTLQFTTGDTKQPVSMHGTSVLIR